MATDVTRPGLGRSRPKYRPEYAGFAGRDAAESLERGLGWFSIGVGAAAIAAPRMVGWLNGLRSPTLMRLVGTRELAAGIGILTQQDRAPWLWTRVVGDTFDLAALFIALARRGRRGRAAVALAAVAGVTALDLLAAMRLSYRMVRDQQDNCVKVELQPWAEVPTLQADEMRENAHIPR